MSGIFFGIIVCELECDFMKSVYIVGAGPSGMMAALSTKKHHPQANVILVERNKRLGTKLRLTGGGRCNVTANVDVETVIRNVPKNGKFLYSSLSHFGPQEIQRFFEEAHCPLKEEDHGRMFPASNKSQSIINALQDELRRLGVEIMYESFVEGIDPEKQILTINSQEYVYDHIILATGSRTLPGSGSDGNGYNLAELFGHTVTQLLPAEVPLVSNDIFIQDKVLQGLSFQDVSLTILQKGKKKQTITHDLLFAHFGISGPAALRASFYVQQVLAKEKPVQLVIDFLPKVSYETMAASEDIVSFLIDQGLPKRLVSYFETLSKHKNDILENTKKFKMTVYDTRGFSHAFVTNGGVSLKEVDPKTMKSKLNRSLSFCGELLDTNAFTGGFNITSAFSTGYTAGKYCLSEETY